MKKVRSERLGCGGAIILVCLIIIIIFAISLNVNSKDRVKELREQIIESDGRILPENEGKLIIISGVPQINNNGRICDEEYSINLENVITYDRTAIQKIYFIDEETTVRKNDINDPYDDETETRRFISKKWINANASRDKVVKLGLDKYKNPDAVDFRSMHDSNTFSVGEFKLDYTVLREVINTERKHFKPSELANMCEGWIKYNSEYNFKVKSKNEDEGYLTTGDDIGDIHVNFSYDAFVSAEPVTIIGKQQGNTIVMDGEGFKEEFHVIKGEITKEQFLKDREAEDAGDRKACIIIISIMSAIILGVLIFIFFVP